MAKSFATVKAEAVVIRDETVTNANTATRVGTAMLDTLDTSEEAINTVSNQKVNISDIVDSLSSVETSKPLSAKQGKVLNDALNELDKKTEFYNVTTRVPLSEGTFYNLSTAIGAIESQYKKIGFKTTFEVSANIWQSYQFTGSSISTWATASNWKLVSVSGLYGNIAISTDLNSIAQTGDYTCYGTASNVPSSSYSWFVEHRNSGVGVVSAYQRAIAYSTEIIIYERTKIASTWGAWEIQGSASNVKVTPTGGITSTNVQNALAELDGEVSELELELAAKADFHLLGEVSTSFDADDTFVVGYFETHGYFIAGGINSSASETKKKVFGGVSYKYTSLIKGDTNLCFYDDNNLFVSAISGTTLAAAGYIFTAPINATQVKVTALTTDVAGGIRLLYNEDFNYLTWLENQNVRLKASTLFNTTYTEGKYINNGSLVTDARYKTSDYIFLGKVRTIKTNTAIRVNYFTFDRVFSTQIDIAAHTEFTTPEGMYFMRYHDALTVNTILYDVNELDDIFTIDIENVLNEYKRDIDLKSFTSVDIANNKGTLVSGNYNEVGSKYKFNLHLDPKYKFEIDFKFPVNINTGEAETAITLASLSTRSSGSGLGGLYGGFLLDILYKKPEPDVSLPIIKQNVSILIKPKANLDDSRLPFKPDGKQNKWFFGEDAFYCRYKEDITMAANQDVKLNITNNGIELYHSLTDVNIFTELFPASKSLQEFCEIMEGRCTVGSDLENILEFTSLHADHLTTDDLIRCNAIKMVNDFGGTVGVDAFPFFAPTVDYGVHNLQIMLNSTNGEVGEKLVWAYIDGAYIPPVNRTFALNSFVEYKILEIGAENFELLSAKLINNNNQNSHPIILNFYTHSIIDSHYDNTIPPGSVSIGFMSAALSLLKKHGYKAISYEDIADYYHNGKLLPEKCFNIIHDDNHKFADITSPIVMKFRNLYSKYQVKVGVAIITDLAVESDYLALKRDENVIECVFHNKDTRPLVTLKYSDILTSVSGGISALSDNYKYVKVMRYHGGSTNETICKIMKHIFGFSISTDHASDVESRHCSLANVSTRMPLISIEDNQYSSLSEFENLITIHFRWT